jgi:hypothetical protein
MQEVKQIDLEEKPSEDQVSYYEESSTKVFTEICIPLIEDDVYSISDLFYEIHVEDIWHASQESHADTIACISGDKKRVVQIRIHTVIFLAQFAETNWIFEFLLGKYPISKNNRLKQSLGTEVMIVSKSTIFLCFSGNGCTVFKISSKIYLDIIHYKKIK